MPTISFPIIFTFSEPVFTGDGCVLLKNDFSDVLSVCTNSSNVVVDDSNATVTYSDKLIYGSSYVVYFDGTPFLDADNNSIPLLEGDYVFSIASTFFWV